MVVALLVLWIERSALRLGVPYQLERTYEVRLGVKLGVDELERSVEMSVVDVRVGVTSARTHAGQYTIDGLPDETEHAPCSTTEAEVKTETTEVADRGSDEF